MKAAKSQFSHLAGRLRRRGFGKLCEGDRIQTGVSHRIIRIVIGE